MSIDLGALLRKHKPEQHLRQLDLRDRAVLASFNDLRPRQGTRLLLDTGIYIAEASGTLAADQSEKLTRIELHHCSICLAEITVGLTNRDVSAQTWPAECEYWKGVFSKLPARRIHIPDRQVWVAAGILTGILTRTQGFQPHQRKDALNDALIFMTDLKAGLPILTENRRDFDWLQQLVPSGRFYLI
jgi:hypothetical protein